LDRRLDGLSRRRATDALGTRAGGRGRDVPGSDLASVHDGCRARPAGSRLSGAEAAAGVPAVHAPRLRLRLRAAGDDDHHAPEGGAAAAGAGAEARTARARDADAGADAPAARGAARAVAMAAPLP